MYKPLFNKVLVEIEVDFLGGNTSDDSMGGEVYREGTVIEVGTIMPTADYPFVTENHSSSPKGVATSLLSKHVMWHEGHEAGTVFEHDNKKYALIFWWDIIGVKG